MTNHQTTERDPMIRGLDFITYPVKDMDRAIAFYRDTLGLAPASTAMGGQWAEFTLADGVTFALHNPEALGEAFVPANGLALRVDDVAAVGRALHARGVTLPRGADPTDTTVCHVLEAVDSEGNRLWLHNRYAPEA